MAEIFDEHVFPFLHSPVGDGSLLLQDMEDARNGIPTPVNMLVSKWRGKKTGRNLNELVLHARKTPLEFAYCGEHTARGSCEH